VAAAAAVAKDPAAVTQHDGDDVGVGGQFQRGVDGEQSAVVGGGHT
jgi:hypothetical protein